MLSHSSLRKRLAGYLTVGALVAAQAFPGLAQQKLAGSSSPAGGPGDGKFQLTIDNIMRGPGLVGYEIQDVRWSFDSQRIYFGWKQASEPREKENDTYVVNKDGTGLAKLSEEDAKKAPPVNGDRSRDKKSTLFTDRGDLFLYDGATGQRRQITSTSDLEMNARFTQDQRRVTFSRGGNLYVMALDGGSLIQLTDIRPAGAAPQAPSGFTGGRGQGQGTTGGDQTRRGTDSQEFVKKEEKELLDIIKRRAQTREENEEKRKKEDIRKPFQLQARQSVQGLQLTPDEKYVIATVIETPEGTKSTIVPNYVTEGGYTEDIPARNKVGDNQARSRMAVIHVVTGEVKWVDHGQKAAPGAGDNNAEQGRQQGGGREGQGSSNRNQPRERDVRLSMPIWSYDGARAILMARSFDNKDRWIMALDPATGTTRVLATEHDDAWVDGPGSNTAGWLGDNRTIYFQSEKDGYAHLYTVSWDGGQPKQLTSGKWEVTEVELANDKERFFITTSEVHPGERHLYVMPASGGERTKITSMVGSNDVTISPDEKSLAFIYSYMNKPPELYVQENRAGATATKVTSSPAPEFWTYNWVEPAIITFPARDGATVYARMYKPKNFKKGGPAVFFVHGAGYLQNVHKWWSSYYREYMFHHLLMENGYMVMDIDYRASSGYGRDWRTGIYRHMGGKDLTDQVDGAAWVVKEHGVDPKRIGLYGGSYGGFITLMAMFTTPDVFAAGAALRPVTDWAHYNHGYTSNILNVPQGDPEAYRQSSPIYFAQNLKGALLICHGMVDVNVHFQDSVRLAQRLIELRKENWELAAYPVEDHGFVEPTSWADEYKRIFKLFQQNLRAEEKPQTAKGK